jgi:hypothetical protein
VTLDSGSHCSGLGSCLPRLGRLRSSARFSSCDAIRDRPLFMIARPGFRLSSLLFPATLFVLNLRSLLAIRVCGGSPEFVLPSRWSQRSAPLFDPLFFFLLEVFPHRRFQPPEVSHRVRAAGARLPPLASARARAAFRRRVQKRVARTGFPGRAKFSCLRIFRWPPVDLHSPVRPLFSACSDLFGHQEQRPVFGLRAQFHVAELVFGIRCFSASVIFFDLVSIVEAFLSRQIKRRSFFSFHYVLMVVF